MTASVRACFWTLLMTLGATAVGAQQTPPATFTVGNPLGLPIVPTEGQTFAPMSSNVKVFGAIFSAESCSYDPVRNLIVVPNRKRRPGDSGQQCLDLVHQPRRLRPYCPMDRRQSQRVGAQRAARERHRRRHSLLGRP